MGLVHQFAIISKESDENIIKSNMESVSISDEIIQYIGDSIKWINTTWNGKRIREGISYHGFSFIEGDEIIKIKNIVIKWKELFFLSPEKFYLTGDFLPDKGKYDKNLIVKNEIIEALNSFIELCEKALVIEGKILHNGI